jgi:predicted HAD superfamily Cof-like phosphohydrolase
MRQSNFKDVGDFHAKFGVTTIDDVPPNALTADVLAFRVGFQLEEQAEFCEAVGLVSLAEAIKAEIAGLKSGRHKREAGAVDLAKAVDALCDSNYVNLGTAHMMGLPFDDAWAEVQRANMAKERATGADDARSVRGHALDVVKPAGWAPPNHEPAIIARVRSGR